MLLWHDCFKATLATEGDRRFVYCEASNQSTDLDDERVMQKALRDSSPYFLKKGNIDLDHLTKIGHRFGIKDPHLFEIGIPIDVQFSGDRTIVKSEIYQGEGAHCERANHFWDSKTKQTPPQRWYPSVAGTVLKRSKSAVGGKVIKSVEAVRWNNLAFAKEPVNAEVPEVSLEPITKSLTLVRALTAGDYQTDVSQLEGGEALRRESLDGVKENTVKKKKKRMKALVSAMGKGMVGDPRTVGSADLYHFYKSVWGLRHKLALACAVSDIKTIIEWRKSNVAI